MSDTPANSLRTAIFQTVAGAFIIGLGAYVADSVGRRLAVVEVASAASTGRDKESVEDRAALHATQLQLQAAIDRLATEVAKTTEKAIGVQAEAEGQFTAVEANICLEGQSERNIACMLYEDVHHSQTCPFVFQCPNLHR